MSARLKTQPLTSKIRNQTFKTRGFVSLARAISKLGVTSRSQAAKLVSEGKVCINGLVVTSPSLRISMEKDKIKIEDKVIKPKKFIYLLMNKPMDVVTTRSDEKKRKTVYDLLGDIKEYVFPIGRLDKDTTGLLLLTNDNRLGERLTNPRSNVSKTYIAELDKTIKEKDLDILHQGVTLDDGYKTLPAFLKIIGDRNSKTKVEITITEGKNRQIHRMFESVGYKVVALKRIRLGNLNIGSTKLGHWRLLTKSEVIKSCSQNI
jgi:pseudouridine synthase